MLTVLNIMVYKRIKQFEQTLLNDQLRVCFTRKPSKTEASSMASNGHGGQQQQQQQQHHGGSRHSHSGSGRSR